jgi:hypothetical protein
MATTSHRHPVRLHLGHPGRRCREPLGGGTPPDTGRHYGLDALAEDVIAARHLIDVGLPDQARALLGAHLDRIDYQHVLDDPALIDACLVYVPLVTGERQLTVARYAHDVAARLYQRQHSRRLAAISTLATVLQQARNSEQAIELWCVLVADYDELGQHAEATSSRTALARCLHTSGRCNEAFTIIATTWRLWRMRPETRGGLAVGQAILRVYLRVLNSCRRHTELAAVLDQARGRDFRSTLHQSLADAGHLTDHRLICAYRPSTTAVHAEPRDLP